MTVDLCQKMQVVVIAFSARALAEACQQASLDPIVLDQFGDRDTLAASRHIPISFGGRNSCLASQLRPHESLLRSSAAILLGGGCENHPRALDYLSTLGVPATLTAQQMQTLRSIDTWRDAAQAAGCYFPTSLVREAGHYAKPGKIWLQKPFRSGGGTDVTRREPDGRPPDPGTYLQREITGRQLGVSCIADRSGCRLLGVTESLGKNDWPGPTEFIYRGSLGPVRLSESDQRIVLKLAHAFRAQTGLRGWLQMDFIQDSAGRLWLLELNPRWTAGMEVLLRTGICNAAVEHLKACGAPLPIVNPQPKPSEAQFGKAVYYAPDDLLITPEFLSRIAALPKCNLGDIPSPEMLGQVIAAGHPVLTLKAELSGSATRQQIIAELHRHRQSLS